MQDKRGSHYYVDKKEVQYLDVLFNINITFENRTREVRRNRIGLASCREKVDRNSLRPSI